MKLRKIKLLNWHIFNDNVINVNGNLLITGDNGNGKSTLIDAVFYVLSGGEERSFNSAANAESKRTLESYVRGKIGRENKTFIRDESDVVAHIALEFYDSIKGVAHVLGCVIAIEGAGKPKSKFYIALNSEIDSLSFTSDIDEIYDFNAFRKNNKECDITDLKDTREGRRTKIAQFFNITSSKKYYDLLTKAIAFRPINSSVSDFVFDFLLKQEDVAIDSLARELSEYKEIQFTIEREKNKFACLGTFIDKAKQYIDNQRDIRYLEVLKREIGVAQGRNEIGKIDSKMTVVKQDAEKSETEMKHYAYEIDQTKKEIELFENKEELKVIKERSDRLEALKGQRNTLINAKEDLENSLLFEMDLMPFTGLKYDFIKDMQSGNFPLINKRLNEYALELIEVKENLRTERSDYLRDKKEREAKIYSLGKELYDIKQGINNYDPKNLRFMELIRSKLKEKYGKDIPVLPLCECIEIIDKSWTNAIEGYLNTQKFDLIIPPEYYYSAAEIYEQYMKEFGLYGVGIVNTRVKFDVSDTDNSLYSKIKVLNPYADAICKRLLGRVLCVDNVRQFKEHRICITKTCMTYSNDTTRAINPKAYAIPFIGADSIVRRKEILEEELNAEKTLLVKINAAIKDVEIKIKTLEHSKISKLIEHEIPDYPTQIQLVEQSITQLDEEIKEMSQSRDIIQISKEFDRVKQKRDDLLVKYQELKDQYEKKGAELHALEVKRDVYQDKLTEAETEYGKFYDALDDIEGYNQYKKEFAIFKVDPTVEIERKLRINSNNQESIKRGMREYSKEYNANLLDDIQYINDFIAEYNKIKDTNLAINEAKAAQAFNNAQQSFKENFISKLHDRMKNVKRELDRINESLKRHPFGRDEETYEFKRLPSGDQEMREYARIIMSGKDWDQKDLFTETLSPHDSEIMQGLFDKLASISDATQSQKDLQKYLDYRQYFQYDILIKNKNQEEYYFSKNNKEKSGGEMQTPFYVVIGACFDELIKRDERLSSACIVAFDEAFNNMDEPRTITLMNYYKQLNIQLIIVVPTNHSHNIIPYVDTVVSLIKKNNHIYETYLYNE